MKEIYCPKCEEFIEMDEELSIADSFDPSVDSHSQTTEPYYICPQCGNVFNSEGELDYEPDESDFPDIDDEDIDNL